MAVAETDLPQGGELGLVPGTVRLVQHSDGWRKQYLAEAQRIKTILAAADIGCVTRHFGSTAVKGMAAKPIVDIAVGFKSSDRIRKAIGVLRSNGYDYVPVANVPGSWFMARGPQGLRQFHVHLMLAGSRVWELRLETCRYLQRSRMARDEYTRAKIRLANQFANDRVAYQRAKSTVIDMIEMRALFAKRRRHIKAHLAEVWTQRKIRPRTQFAPVAPHSSALLRHVPRSRFVVAETRGRGATYDTLGALLGELYRRKARQ